MNFLTFNTAITLTQKEIDGIIKYIFEDHKESKQTQAEEENKSY